MSDSFSISNTTKRIPPRVPFRRIKESVLGKRASVSLVFIGDRRSQTLNRTYRNKHNTANVLTFPLGKSEGEIFINLRQAGRDTKSFDLSYRAMVALLFIHGLLHLKGSSHGSTMERTERTWLKKFDR